MTRSCHHGDINDQNNLEAALRVADEFPEIDVYEIDFVCDGKRIVSSHDYNSKMIECGSELEKWIDAIVVGRGKILWIDVKQNLDFYFAWSYGTFDALSMFARLAEARLKWGSDVMNRRIWIGCQDVALREQIMALCQSDDWPFILDIPTISGYIMKCLTPHCLTPKLPTFIEKQMRHTDYQHEDIISIDRSFFSGPKELKRFVVSLHLRPGVTIVLNSFPRTQQPIHIEDHRIVMQYDYTTMTTEEK